MDFQVQYNEDWLKFITYAYINGGFGELEKVIDLFVFYPFIPDNFKITNLLLLWRDLLGEQGLSEIVCIYNSEGLEISIDNVLSQEMSHRKLGSFNVLMRLPILHTTLDALRLDLERNYFGSPIQPNDIRVIKNLIHSVFEFHYKMYGLSFELDVHKFSKMFETEGLLDTVARLYLSGLIRFDGYGIEVIRKGYVSLVLNININKEFEDILNANLAKKDLLIESAFSDMYTRVSVNKKGGKAILIERDLEFSGEGTKFIELQKKYPHSEIKAKSYKGDIMKYEVKEKIRLDTNE